MLNCILSCITGSEYRWHHSRDYPETNVTNEIMQELVHIIQNVFVFLLVMIGFLTIVCFLLLRPLNKIKHALSDFSVGIDLDEPPKEMAWNRNARNCKFVLPYDD